MFNNDHEMYHFGIKGMHWGIRRYQHPNGSLTPLGKERVANSIANAYRVGAAPRGTEGVFQRLQRNDYLDQLRLDNTGYTKGKRFVNKYIHAYTDATMLDLKLLHTKKAHDEVAKMLSDLYRRRVDF